MLKVAKLGPKAFEQCAGFMRIQGGKKSVGRDRCASRILRGSGKTPKKQGFKPEDITGGNLTGLSLTIRDYARLAEELGIGEITLRDIVKELENLPVIRVKRCRNRSCVRMCWRWKT